MPKNISINCGVVKNQAKIPSATKLPQILAGEKLDTMIKATHKKAPTKKQTSSASYREFIAQLRSKTGKAIFIDFIG